MANSSFDRSRFAGLLGSGVRAHNMLRLPLTIITASFMAFSSSVNAEMTDDQDAQVVMLVVSAAELAEQCATAFPSTKPSWDTALRQNPLFDLRVPGLAAALLRDSPQRTSIRAQTEQDFLRAPKHEIPMQCEGHLDFLQRPEAQPIVAHLSDLYRSDGEP